MTRKEKQKPENALRCAIESLNREAQAFKAAEVRYKEHKERYTEIIGRYFDKYSLDRYSFKRAQDETIVVNRVQKTSVKFDAEKLERTLNKDIAVQVIQKAYCVEDMEGLVEYLRACGVSAKVFKSFIRVDRSVDQDALERLVESGEIAMEDLDGCYELVQAKPYFTVKELR